MSSSKEKKGQEDVKADRTLDAIGLYCPEPIFRTKEEIEKLEVGQILEILADDPAAEEDITRWAKRTGNQILKLEKSGRTLRFLVKKLK
ncbi:MAG: sulfurtransferase TusA family protein [Candidatus Freyarchaeota archaeon]|nr:sulfurtransferase TusA family protein [Candidatus Jordarchaeia archaeon]MBS7269674.1 sulfurtransferase TusA family protein [Candidatus Jordarchaeia archaeon]MBS7280468.1 sulfurtransferase TusA family protein [Candidatus Jordarchaeia archaeon]